MIKIKKMSREEPYINLNNFMKALNSGESNIEAVCIFLSIKTHRKLIPDL